MSIPPELLKPRLTKHICEMLLLLNGAKSQLPIPISSDVDGALWETLKDRGYLEVPHTANSVWLLTVKVAHRQVVSLVQLAKTVDLLAPAPPKMGYYA